MKSKRRRHPLPLQFRLACCQRLCGYRAATLVQLLSIEAVKKLFGKVIGPAAIVLEPVEFRYDENTLSDMCLQMNIHELELVKCAPGHGFSGVNI
jgi:hypothetical protein